MGMFDTYNNLDPNYIPDNMHKHFPCKCNKIVSGGSNLFVFELDSGYGEDLINAFIIFKQEAKILLIKEPSTKILDEHSLYLECNLTPEESQEFGGTYLDTLTQIKLEYSNKILYSDEMKIKVIGTLDNNML